MAGITTFEGYELLVLNVKDVMKTGMTIQQFMDQTSGVFVTKASDAKEILERIGVQPSTEHFIVLLGELALKVGEETIMAMLHHEVAHLKMNHYDLGVEIVRQRGQTSGAVNLLEHELQADAYAAGVVGKKKMLRSLRRMIFGSLIFMSSDGARIKRAARRAFAIPDFAQRLEAMGGVEGRHFYRTK